MYHSNRTQARHWLRRLKRKCFCSIVSSTLRLLSDNMRIKQRSWLQLLSLWWVLHAVFIWWLHFLISLWGSSNRPFNRPCSVLYSLSFFTFLPVKKRPHKDGCTAASSPVNSVPLWLKDNLAGAADVLEESALYSAKHYQHTAFMKSKGEVWKCSSILKYNAQIYWSLYSFLLFVLALKWQSFSSALMCQITSSNWLIRQTPHLWHDLWSLVTG